MKIQNLPNLLTGLRLLFVPLFVVFFLNGNPEICALLFILSGISDVADGCIARRWRCESNLGKILDPIADKLTYAAAFICLYTDGRLPLYFLLIFCGIQLAQGIGALFVYKSRGTVVRSNAAGKLAGFSMFLLCAVSLLFYDFLQNKALINILCAVVLVVMALAGILYFLQYIHHAKSVPYSDGKTQS